ncbi:MAG: hypothetical protein KF819_32670 [Labilithrix sp.]|nr:hypothetical protein [Labilithrix sp.]
MSEPPGRLPPPIAPPMKKVAAPEPSPEGFMSTHAKMSLADIALALRDEQLQAQVIHYKAELETNSELDAVTQQVIEELQGLQAAARAQQPGSMPPLAEDRAQLEINLIQSLKEMLGRIFRPGKLATIIERKLGEVAKRFARTFFASELHEKLRGSSDEVKAMRYSEQALYHALARVQHQVVGQLDAYNYVSPKVQKRAKERFAELIKELRNDFLARTTPELNQLVKYLNDSLVTFFTQELPPILGELAWEVVKEAKLADARTLGGYKISASAFPGFRVAFERRFLQRLVPFVADEMLTRVRDSMGQFRTETTRFVADPSIFSDVCEVICESVYDMLYNDGFLDLPNDWRTRLTVSSG